MGVLAQMMNGLAFKGTEQKTGMIDVTYLMAHRTASLRLQAVIGATSRPLRFVVTAAEVSDYTGAAALLGSLHTIEWLIADRGYGADWFRDVFKRKDRRPCIPGPMSYGKAVRYDKRR